MKKLLYFCLLLTSTSLLAQEIRNSISLEGDWEFRIDSMDVGISEKWFSGSSENTIKLPGSMAENGFGYDITPDIEIYHYGIVHMEEAGLF